MIPAVIPVTRPEEEPMVAFATLLLLQDPPVILLVSKVVIPGHTLLAPAIAAGVVFTEMSFVAMQPPGNVYEIVAILAL